MYGYSNKAKWSGEIEIVFSTVKPYAEVAKVNC